MRLAPGSASRSSAPAWNSGSAGLAPALALALVLVGRAPPVFASEPAAAKEAPGASAGTATILVVSEDAVQAALRPLFLELLGRDGVACEVNDAPRFDPDALFTERRDDASVVVFVVVEPKRARLYFRGPGGERFLLRKLALSRGADEVGKELIGQVVESSILALLRSSAGVSREQASLEVERDEREARPPPKATVGARPQAGPARSPSPLTLGIAARYAGELAGPGFGLSHGPGAEVHVGYRRTVAVRLRVSAERPFSQTLRADAIRAKVDTLALRAGADGGLSLGPRNSIALGVLAGFDSVRVEPTHAESDNVELAAADSRLVPILRVEARYELVLAPLTLAVGVLADASLVRTHYDLVRGATRERILTPWPVRPGMSAAIGLGF